MKFNFKKISAIGSSLLLAGMSVAMPIAAANYPAPFVVGGAADVAVVYGSKALPSDIVESANIQSSLQSYMSGTSGTGSTITGEAYALFTGSRKIYMNDSINTAKSSLTDSQLPTVLADSDFEGDVNADVTQTIKLSSNARLQFDNYPTSDDDPVVAISLGTTSSDYIYNATVNFNKAVNLSHSDSIGEDLKIFGQKYTVGAGTTNTTLYLYKSSQTVDLSIGGSDPTSQTVTVDGKTYTVELTGASDTSATIKVTDSDGNSESKEITEDNSKKVQGIDIAVNLADEDTATNRLTAQITVGANKLKLVDGDEVRIGSDEDIIDGTKVYISGSGWQATTGFTIQVWAPDTDHDAIVEGESFVDPVFGSFKIDFSGLNIDANSSDRETIEVKNSGDDKATVKFTTHTGDEKTINWYYNSSATARLADSTGDAINVIEGAQINKSEYVVVGNEEKGYLLELKSIYNATSGYSDDYVEFQDVFSGKSYKSDSASGEGTATLSVEGEDYTVTYVDDKSVSGDEYVRLNYPDSTSAGDAIIYPTIETSKGAKLFFYEPLTINLAAFDGSNALTKLRFPDGDGYTDVSSIEVINGTAGNCLWNITAGGTEVTVNTSNPTDVNDVTIGQLTYQVQGSGTNNQTTIKLEDVGGTAISLPAIVLFEEQDDSTDKLYNAVIVKMEGAGTSSNGVGVTDVEETWGSDSQWDNKQLQSDTDIYKDMDYYGVIVTTDRSESDQYTATISYPNNQVYAQIYMAEESASITAGTSGSGISTTLGNILFKDTETSSYANKNIIVVGGSCVNSAAASLVGGAYCGADWTDATGVGSGEYLIKGYQDSSLAPGKLALLVAGYEAADTANAVTYLTKKNPDTSKAWKGTTSTSATQITTEA